MNNKDIESIMNVCILDELLQRIKARNFTVGIVGLGYVGLPLAMAAIRSGFQVLGLDINESRVELLNRGESGIKHIPSAPIAEASRAGCFRATSDFSELDSADAILIAVPTPLSRQREPDLTYVENSARNIAKVLRCGQLIVLESHDLARNYTGDHAANFGVCRAKVWQRLLPRVLSRA